LPNYSLSKACGHLLLQKIAEEVDRERLQIVSFHPGQILSETARLAGLDETSFQFDDGSLPGVISFIPHFMKFC
jgi:NAD(P)-dependent dehydrogenase (short-subunit alcohol dehydrogenase family)